MSGSVVLRSALVQEIRDICGNQVANASNQPSSMLYMRLCGNPRGSDVAQGDLESFMRVNAYLKAIPTYSVVQDGLKMLGIRGMCKAFY
jgi:hypothetical protein